jgi:hypothetical protein
MRAFLFAFLLFHFAQFLNSQTDTTSSLLPDKMSVLEKGLWGKNGLFRITGLAPLTPEARQSELKLRRAMLSIHQIGGFTTLGLMAISAYYGKKAYDLVPWFCLCRETSHACKGYDSHLYFNCTFCVDVASATYKKR